MCDTDADTDADANTEVNADNEASSIASLFFEKSTQKCIQLLGKTRCQKARKYKERCTGRLDMTERVLKTALHHY